jgi:hypothetical protein
MYANRLQRTHTSMILLNSSKLLTAMSLPYGAGRQINYEQQSNTFQLSISNAQVLCIGKILDGLLH